MPMRKRKTSANKSPSVARPSDAPMRGPVAVRANGHLDTVTGTNCRGENMSVLSAPSVDTLHVSNSRQRSTTRPVARAYIGELVLRNYGLPSSGSRFSGQDHVTSVRHQVETQLRQRRVGQTRGKSMASIP